MMDAETARQIRKQLLKALKNPPFNDPKAPQLCSYGRNSDGLHSHGLQMVVAYIVMVRIVIAYVVMAIP